ncbi:S41 family peptidase [Candidatus Saccharibacteria bacterium]|nr:S41 family peptidase [Candidatus Saccharibacteria bacterium]
MSNKTNWQQKKVNLSTAIIVGGAIAVAGVVFGIFGKEWFGGFAPYLGIKTSTHKIDWSELDDVYDTLASNYDGEINNEDVIEGAKKGLTAALGDIYTTYMDAEETSAFMDNLHGAVGSGVGIEMGLRDGYVRVIRTLPDNPAKKAGVMAGDIIYKVNDEEVYMLSTEEIANKVRGETGTEVTLTVVREGKELSFTMIRETINNVSAYVNYEGSTAIVTITRFDNDTGAMVYDFAKEFASKGINKVILDLRDNGGGYVAAAQDLLSLWIENQDILIQKSMHFGTTKVASYFGKALLKDMKTIVLVNGSTASASEIVAGALQDYGKATILGEKTYGKGVIQQMFDLDNGAMLKITIASWYTPKDRSINKDGITPDIEVARTYEDINTMKDPQMDKAKEL